VKRTTIFIIILILFISICGFSFIELSVGNSVCSGVTPHHLLARDVIDNFFKYTSKHSNPDTIIIFSPDHFNKGNLFEDKFITVESKEFSGVKINKVLLNELARDNPIAPSDTAVFWDHGIMNLLPFVKKYFPHSTVVPFLIPQAIDYPALNKFTESLNSLASKKAIVIASVDFSHYLPKTISDFHDIKSIRTLINFDKSNFNKIEVDSWQALYIARYFARMRRMEHPFIIAHKNANDYVKDKTLYSTTSYFSVAFGRGKPEKLLSDTQTMLFTGDVMLGRGVGNLIQRNSPIYPFEKIKIALRGIDYVIGNLEGPISKTAVKYPEGVLKFSFDEDVINGLLAAHFNILSLANNHTFDSGEKGLNETRKILKESGINSVGDPVKAEPKYCLKEKNIIFLGFNAINQFKEKEILHTVKVVRKDNPDKFLIVIFHWGIEYQEKNSLMQEELAQETADNGADLIIGAHPHVVQNIEIYKPTNSNKEVPIFYSLGNFVFDQYFSKETQQGLMVGVELSKNKEVLRLFPIQSSLSQPELMKPVNATLFLNHLATISDKKLTEEIKNGIITINRK